MTSEFNYETKDTNINIYDYITELKELSRKKKLIFGINQILRNIEGISVILIPKSRFIEGSFDLLFSLMKHKSVPYIFVDISDSDLASIFNMKHASCLGITEQPSSDMMSHSLPIEYPRFFVN